MGYLLRNRIIFIGSRIGDDVGSKSCLTRLPLPLVIIACS